MGNQDHTDQHAAAANPPAAIPALSRAGAARRRIAGLGVSGVLMTVASTHGMADTVCKSPSGNLSGKPHTSHAPEGECVPGETPAWWSDQTSLLAQARITKHTKFKEILPTNRAFGEQTVLNVLKGLGNQGEHGVPKLMMATYLNVVVEPKMINYLTRQAVLDMWANYNEDLHYNHPGSSQRWDSYEFAQYLIGTQSL